MAAKAAAWLGWAPDQALRADVKFIEIALHAFIEHRNLVYFHQAPTPTRRRVSASMFRAFARDHNAGWEQRRH